MKKIINIFGDSLMKGIFLEEDKNRYVVSNTIFWKKMEEKYNVKINNHSRMGATISYGEKRINNFLKSKELPSIVLIEYGGNDSDYDWAEVSKTKSRKHQPKTDPKDFYNRLSSMVKQVKESQSIPVLMNLPAIDAKKFYNTLLKNNMNEDNVMYFLGDIQTIYRHHENYSWLISKIANEENIPLIDIRSVFLDNIDYLDLIGSDGIHLTKTGETLVFSRIIEEMLRFFG